jgi:hypothetical protein
MNGRACHALTANFPADGFGAVLTTCHDRLGRQPFLARTTNPFFLAPTKVPVRLGEARRTDTVSLAEQALPSTGDRKGG